MRASESNRRKKQWGLVATFGKREGDAGFVRMLNNDDVRGNMQACATKGQLIVSPLYSWEDADIWDFIYDRRLPYCELYDQGFDRLGCIGCPSARQCIREYEFSRWPGFKRLYVKAFDGLIENGRFTKRGHKSGAEVFEWWMQDRAQEAQLEGQEEMEVDYV